MISKILKIQGWNFKSCSRSLEQFFLTVGQNNFGNKIPLQTFFYEVAKAFSEAGKKCSKFETKIILDLLLEVENLFGKLTQEWKIILCFFPPFLTAWLWNTGEFVIYVYLLFPLNWTVWGCHFVALELKVGFEFWNMSLNYNCRIKNNSRFFTFSCLS